MRVRIDNDIYNIEEVLDLAPLGDLIALKYQSKGKLGNDRLGLDVPWIKARLNGGLTSASEAAIAAKQAGADDDELAALITDTLRADADFLAGIVGLIFLSRRRDHIEITVKKASEFDWSSIDLLDDEDEPELAPLDEEEEPDPKVPSTDPVESNVETPDLVSSTPN